MSAEQSVSGKIEWSIGISAFFLLIIGIATTVLGFFREVDAGAGATYFVAASLAFGSIFLAMTRN